MLGKTSERADTLFDNSVESVSRFERLEKCVDKLSEPLKGAGVLSRVASRTFGVVVIDGPG